MLGFEDLALLREHHPAWRLLRADSAPLVAGFLSRLFVAENRRTVTEPELIDSLDDYLYQLQQSDPQAFPRTAREYLRLWSAPERGWLRKYYPPDSDIPAYDITPATEKALVWLDSLAERSFVGTESRLLTAVELLRQMAEGADADPQRRIEVLQDRRQEIDAEIERIRGGDLDVLDEAALRDRFQQFATTARGLLADFREVEENFRRLDREVRERIASWTGPRGELLAEVFGEREAIGGSDQGRSFRAFWDLLMSAGRQEELQSLLDEVLQLPPVVGMDPGLRNIQSDWLHAGDAVQQTVAHLSRQLRRFLDDQAYLENRRIAELVHRIGARAVQLRDTQPRGPVESTPGTKADISAPMIRRLYEPSRQVELRSESVVPGAEDFSATELFDQVSVDPVRLRRSIQQTLGRADQVTLAEVVGSHPIELGLAEVITYLRLADEDEDAIFDGDRKQRITWQQPAGVPVSQGGVAFVDEDQASMVAAEIPLVIFTRPRKKPGRSAGPAGRADQIKEQAGAASEHAATPAGQHD